MLVSLLPPAGGLGGAALPVAGPRESRRVLDAKSADAREVPRRGAWILEEAERDPSGHEFAFDAVILLGR